MKNKRKIPLVVISDVHLGTYGCQATELLQYLKSIQPKTLVLNGDIIDMWNFSKSYFPSSHMNVLRHIIKMSANGTRLIYITGNHDEVLRKYSDLILGTFELVDKLVLDLDKIITFDMPKYHMSLYWYHKNELTGIAGSWKLLKDKDLNDERWRRNAFQIISGGHYLTSMGTLDYLIKKVRGFAHQELVSSDVDEQLKHCWTYGHDLANEKFTEITLESANYPKWIMEQKAPAGWYRKRP
jgi:hypothetical protein